MAESKHLLLQSFGSKENLTNSPSQISINTPTISPPNDLYCPTLREYLLTKPSKMLEKMYEYPSICMAVYRELPDYAQHYVIRILYVDQPVPQAVITSWGMQQYSKSVLFLSYFLLQVPFMSTNHLHHLFVSVCILCVSCVC